MAMRIEEDGDAWIICSSVTQGDRAIDAYWSGSEWVSLKVHAERFKAMADAESRTSSLPPLVLKTVIATATMAVDWDDSHALSALLARARSLIARGQFQSTSDAQNLVEAVESNDPHRAELSQRLRDLCEAAEARSRAEGLFFRIMSREPSQRAIEIRSMVNSSPPTFEEEWLEFKGGFHGSAAKPEPFTPELIKETWSTALSGFANAGGGVLIWGVDCRQVPSASDPKKMVDAAGDVRLVPHPDSLKSQLMTLHHVATDPPVGGVRVEPIGDFAGGGFVVCLIPESRAKPHRAEFVTNKPYYMRAGDDFVVMPHAVLRSLFYPHNAPRYTVTIECSGRNLQNAAASVDFIVTVTNVGLATAREPFLVFQVERWKSIMPQTAYDGSWQLRHVRSGLGCVGGSSIHPGATAPSIRLFYPCGGRLNLTGILQVKCVVHALDSEPKTFSATFDCAEIAADKKFTVVATETLE